MDPAKTSSNAPASNPSATSSRELDDQRYGVASGGESAESPVNPKDAVTDAVKSAKEMLSDKLEESGDRVAASLEGAAGTLRKAAGEVEADQAWIAVALRKSADGLDALTQSWAGGQVNRVVEDLGGFARRQPAVFLGVALAAGFSVARIGKAAAAQAQNEGQNGHGR